MPKIPSKEAISKEQFLELADHPLPPSSWMRIDQERIDQFAEATGDHQFIHVDPQRAAKTPFGGTIAHGFLTLSLLPKLSEEVALRPEGVVMGINYGLNKVRMLQPVRSGSEVRLQSKILGVVEKAPGRLLVTTEATVEIKGEDKPALIAETLAMFVLGS